MKISPLGFKCLLLFIAHCPYTFSSLALHKRMMSPTRVVEVADTFKDAGSISKTHDISKLHIDPHAPSAHDIHGPYDPSHFDADVDEEIFMERNPGRDVIKNDPHPSDHIPPEGHTTASPEGRPPPEPKTRSPGLFESMKRRFSASIDKFAWYIERLRLPEFFRGGNTRFFSHASDLEKSFGKLPDEEDKIKDVIRPIIHKLVVKHQLQQYSIPEELVEKTASTLARAKQLLKEVSSSEDQHKLVRQSMQKELDTILRSKGGTSKLSSSLASLQSRQLIDAQVGITHLLHSDIKYVSNLHGLLGPENVFSPELEKLLARKEFVDDLPSNFNSKQFVSDLVSQRDNFKRVVAYLDQVNSAAKQLLVKPPFPHGAIDKLSTFGGKYSEIMAQHGGMTNLVTKIRGSDVFKGLRRDFINPKSAAGEELALLEPLGIARDPGYILFREFPSDQLGITQEIRSLPILLNQQRAALPLVTQRLTINSNAKEIKDSLLELFSPTQLDALASQIIKNAKKQ